MGAQEGAQAGEVGLGAAHQQVHLAVSPDRAAIRAVASRECWPSIAELLPAVVRHQGLEHCGMGAFRVVVEEHQHAAYGRSPWRGPAEALRRPAQGASVGRLTPPRSVLQSATVSVSVPPWAVQMRAVTEPPSRVT